MNDPSARLVSRDAWAIRTRAETRLGELMEAQRQAGLLKRGNPKLQKVAGGPITLAEAGIDKHLADRARGAFYFRE